MAKETDYQTLSRAYNNLLERVGVNTDTIAGTTGQNVTGMTENVANQSGGGSGNKTSSTNGANGSVEMQPVKSDGAMGDVWIKNFIRSMNWKPKKQGFYIDGLTGYAEFSNVFVSGNIQAKTGVIGGFAIGATDLYSTDGVNETIISSGPVAFSAGPIGSPSVTITQAGELTATSGYIAGWEIQPTLLRSAPNGSRIELNKGKNRVSIFDAVNEKVVMGYLNGLPKHDGTGFWGAADYGFWALAGDKLSIDGDGEYVNGDWIIQHDAAYLINDAYNNTIVRLGTDTGEKGLFIYDTTGTKLAKYTSNEIFIGDLNQYVQYDTVNGLNIKGNITITGGNASVTFYQADAPVTGMKAGDYWIDTDDNSLHVYQGGLWILVAASGVKVFMAEPTTPYHVGDLWMTSASAATGDLKKCITEKLTGAYSAADWVIATKYTDDSALNNFVSFTYDPAILDLQSQIDGNITSWFYAGVPTLLNAPASTWTTDPIKDTHLGDLYYDQNTGYAYRFMVSVGVYSWLKLSDSDIAAALAAANNAQDTADGKRRVFMVQPTTPYDVGDLWMTSGSPSTGDLKKCITAQTTGPYVAADWVIATKYTEGADWGTNLSNIPVVLGAPAGTGLFISSTNMGYYTGGAWKTYMDNAGNLVLGDIVGGNTGMSWSQLAGTLTIKGAITADTGYIGGATGWVISSNYIKDVAGVTGMSSLVTAGDDIRFWAGHVTPASAPFRVTESGALIATSVTVTGAITAAAGSSIGVSYLSGTIPQTNLNLADRGWTQTCAFSVTDADTVSWGSGALTSTDGTVYTISAGNTGNMVSKTYIYLDIAVSLTAYQITTTATTAIGPGKVLVAVAQNGGTLATYALSETSQITGDSIVANTIVAGKMNVSTLSAITANLGTITAGTVTGALIRTNSGGTRVELDGANNMLAVYYGGELRGAFDGYSLTFLGPSEVGGGQIWSAGSNQLNINTGGNGYEFTDSIFYSDSNPDLGSSSYPWYNLYADGLSYLSGRLRIPVGTNLY